MTNNQKRLNRRPTRRSRLVVRDPCGDVLLTLEQGRQRRHGRIEWRILHDERTSVEVVTPETKSC
jgi:hypothetical protein